MDPIRPVGPEVRPVPPVHRRVRDDEAERRERERRGGRHNAPGSTARPGGDSGDGRDSGDGGEGDGPLIDVRA